MGLTTTIERDAARPDSSQTDRARGVELRSRRPPSPDARLRARSGRVPERPGAMHETELSRTYRSIAATLVERVVSLEMGVSVDALHARTRSIAQVAFARQVAMYLAHTIFKITQSDIGERFARDRTTVRHACERVEDRRDDAAFEARLVAMETICEQALYGMQLFALQAETVSERVLVEIGARPDLVEDRR